MGGAARPPSKNQKKGSPQLNQNPRQKKSNTIAKANKTIPAETPIIPVTLITRPIMISLSAIADLLAPSYLITSSAGASHESKRNPGFALAPSCRKESTPRRQGTPERQALKAALVR